MPIGSVPNGVGKAMDDELSPALAAAADVLRRASAVTVLCHENPDADTLGGGLALALALDQLGIDAEVVCATRWPSTLDFLPHVSDVRAEPHLDAGAIVLVDCASIDRAGTELARWIRESGRPIVNVDHHASNDGYGSVACIDRSAAATSEIVARLVISELACPPDADVATLLLAGILHDTDGLRVPETSAATLRRAADLVEAGAQIAAISRELFARRPLAALRLWGRVVSDLEAVADGRIVIGRLTSEMLAASGAMLLDAEDLPELIATAQGAEISLLLRQVGPQETRVSIRTSGTVDAAGLAVEFGGGGHERAGGCTIAAGLVAARERLLGACQRHLAAIDSDPARVASNTPETGGILV